MDRYLVAGAVCLLLLEIFVLVADLDVVRSERARSTNATNVMIGELKRAENDVRRRGHSSLVWDESRTEDSLYAYDSILTLKDSAAQIRLQGDTILNLDENTLVVLEPSSASDSGSLRIRFSRGTFRSRNPSYPMTIGSDGFSVEASAGAELSLIGLDDGRFEVELQRGEAKLATATGSETITSGQRVRVANERIEEKTAVSHDLTWTDNVPSRIYSSQLPVVSRLRWVGTATEIEIVSPDRSSRRLPIGEATEFEAELPRGTSLIRLLDAGKTSSTRTIQIREAPRLRYFAPLPRDRARTESQVLFSWQRLPEAQTYRLEISPSLEFSGPVQQYPSTGTRLATSISTMGSYFWRVIGIDADGFEIPAPRAYPLYLTPRPLQAPTLEDPEVREPASPDGARHVIPPRQPHTESHAGRGFALWNLLIVEARAETRVSDIQKMAPRLPATSRSSLSATFSWGPVDGADHYVIEISKTPGFEDPLVVEKVRDTRFVWKGFAVGAYFWRVAAGTDITHDDGTSSDGVDGLGLFSAPALARLDPSATNRGGKGVELTDDTVPSTGLSPLPSPSPPVDPVATIPSLKPKPKPKPLPSRSPVPSDKLAAESPPPSPTKPASHALSTPRTMNVADPSEAHMDAGGTASPTGRVWSVKVLAAPRFIQKTTKNRSAIEGSFEGVQPYAGDVIFDIGSGPGRRLRSRASFSTNEWRPKESKNTFQKPLRESVFSFDISYRPRPRVWSVGVGAESLAIFTRAAPERGRFETRVTGGPSLNFEWTSSSGNNEFDLRLESRFGDGWSGGRATASWLHSPYSNERIRSWIGPYLSGASLRGDGNRSWIELSIGLRVGAGW